jgi:hypothetical protein
VDPAGGDPYIERRRDIPAAAPPQGEERRRRRRPGAATIAGAPTWSRSARVGAAFRSSYHVRGDDQVERAERDKSFDLAPVGRHGVDAGGVSLGVPFEQPDGG